MMKSIAVVVLSIGLAACAHAPKPPLAVSVAVRYDREPYGVSKPVSWEPSPSSKAATLAVTVRNTTAEPLHVARVKLSSNRLQHSYVEFDETVAPGASATRSIRFVQVDQSNGFVSQNNSTRATTVYTRPGETTPQVCSYVIR